MLQKVAWITANQTDVPHLSSVSQAAVAVRRRADLPPGGEGLRWGARLPSGPNGFLPLLEAKASLWSTPVSQLVSQLVSHTEGLSPLPPLPRMALF